MRIINVSDKPYEWMWDGGVYGPLMPGQIGDYPDPIARQAIQKSEALDDAGEPLGDFKVKTVDQAKKDGKGFDTMALYPCSICGSGSYLAQELVAHMETHRPKQAIKAADLKQTDLGRLGAGR